MSNNTKALKSGVWYTVSSFLARSIGFLVTPFFARMLTKTEFGLYNNYSSWLIILTVFVTLHLESTLISARYDFENKFDEYIFSILGLSAISASIWLVVVNIFRDFFCSLLKLDIIYLDFLLVYLVFSPAVQLYLAREIYYFEYKKMVFASLFISIGTSLLSILLVFLMNDKLTGRIVGEIIPTIILGGIFFAFFFSKGKRIRIKYWKYAIPICLPYIPHLLSLNILNAMDRTMITRFCGAEDNAVYSIAYSCGAIVTILGAALNSAYAPWLGEKLANFNEENVNEIRKYSKFYIICFLILAVGIMVVTPEILFLLGGKQYLDAKFVLAPISMGCVCQFLYTIFVNVEQFKKKTIGMAFASVIAALINLILNGLFIPRIGYQAAAYTTLIGYISLLVMHMLLVKRLKLEKIYSYKFVYGVVLVGIGIMMLMIFLYSHDIIRYIFILIYIMIIVFYLIRFKDKIFEILSTFKKSEREQ